VIWIKKASYRELLSSKNNQIKHVGNKPKSQLNSGVGISKRKIMKQKVLLLFAGIGILTVTLLALGNASTSEIDSTDFIEIG